MREHLKQFFIPHEENNYHPHILHTKRALFYSAFFLSLKACVFLFALMIPSVAFVMPDVLSQEENKLLTLTNNLRREQGLSTLSPMIPLQVSAGEKVADMANLNYFSHTSPESYGLSDFLALAGYNYETAGENLAMGFSTAEEIFSAWMKSPSHAANLLDPEFTEFGVSMRPGFYGDQSTVYVAQHFGSPKILSVTSFPQIKSKNEASAATSSTSTLPQITGTLSDDSIRVFAEESFIVWKDEGDISFFQAEVKAVGEIKNAAVSIGAYSFPLVLSYDGVYRGELRASEPINNFFKPVVEPSLQIVDTEDRVHYFTIAWKKVKIVSLSPLEKYSAAKSMEGGIGQLFNFSRGVYIFFLVFFSLALLISIGVEIRKQHHHITAQTIGLLLLLISLIII